MRCGNAKARAGAGTGRLPPGPAGPDRVSGDLVQRLLEAAGVAALGFRQSLEPVGDLVEALVAGGPGHARIHVGVFVGLAGDGGFQVVLGVADRLAGRRVAGLFEISQMAVGVAGFAFGG